MADGGATLADGKVASSGTVASAEGASSPRVGGAARVEATEDLSTTSDSTLFNNVSSIMDEIKELRLAPDNMADGGATEMGGGVVASPGKVTSATYRTLGGGRVMNANPTIIRPTSLIKSVLSMREEIKELRQEVASRDILLQKLEESVTRLAEDLTASLTVNLTPLKDYFMSRMREEMVHGSSVKQAIPPNGEAGNKEQEKIIIRNRCVEAMVRVTEILDNNEEKTSKLRAVYEIIYDTAPLAAFILRVLERHGRVKILIDFDNQNTHRLKKRVVDHDAEKRSGVDIPAFADLSKLEVYAAVTSRPYFVQSSTPKTFKKVVQKTEEVIDSLVECLAQAAICIVFDNGGFPCADGDDTHEKLYENIVASAVLENDKSLDGLKNLDGALSRALKLRTTVGREIGLVAVVPGMLVKYGFQDGLSRLYEQLPILPLFYMKHVLPKMMTYTRVSTGGL